MVDAKVNFILCCGSRRTQYPHTTNIKRIWERQPVAQSVSEAEASVLFGSFWGQALQSSARHSSSWLQSAALP